jgi:PPM family protein phosphatase
MSSDDRQRWLSGSIHAFHDSPPPGADVQVDFGAESRRGAQRPVNEDHYLILRLGRHQETLMTSLSDGEVPPRFDEYGYAMVVADGVGGTGAGETASRLAIATLVHMVTDLGRWNVRIDDTIAREVMARAERFYRGVDSTLLYKSRDSGPGLQTTLTAAWSAGRDLFIAHVGHSRAYRLRNRELVRLTRDHTLAEEGGGSGPLFDLGAAARDLHHVLTETIGSADLHGPQIDIDRWRLADGDLVLLCTNGLTDMVSEGRMADVLGSDRTAGEQCAALVNLAVEAGGVDDVTVLVARYRLAEE